MQLWPPMPTDPDLTRTLAYYDGQLELAKEWARRRQAAFNEVVDFVEEHGGALSGEQRGELWELCERMAR